MSPRRTPKHSPEQEALDLGIFGAEPVAPTEPAELAETAEPVALAEPHKRERGVPLLSDEQLRTTAELTVRDLAAFARGEASREELSERAARRTSAPYRKALRALKHSLGPAAHAMTDDALYELVDIALAARQTAQPETTQPEEPTPKKPARKAPARKKPAQKELAQKASAKKAPAERKAAVERKAPTEKSTSVSVAAEAKSRALARYAAEDSLENTPLKKYLPAPSAKAIATHLGITTVGQMLEYFPRKYLPRGELSSFAELVEGQDVTIIARVVHVSTRTMAARRGKITEVTITDRLADSSAH